MLESETQYLEKTKSQPNDSAKTHPALELWKRRLFAIRDPTLLTIARFSERLNASEREQGQSLYWGISHAARRLFAAQRVWLAISLLWLGLSNAAQAQNQQARAVGNGTAFAINSDGEFLTNYHVVKNCTGLRLRWNGDKHDVSVVTSDEQNDLAVVRTSTSEIEPLKFREGKGIRPGDGVVVLGFPYSGLLSTNPQVTTGGVSALSGVRDDIRVNSLPTATPFSLSIATPLRRSDWAYPCSA